jgi:hypothetical protein
MGNGYPELLGVRRQGSSLCARDSGLLRMSAPGKSGRWTA